MDSQKTVKHSYHQSLGYSDGLQLQEEAWENAKSGSPTLLLVEHKPVFTFGKSANRSNLLTSRELLSQNGIELFDTDRGGDITFHGPGQLVGYPIINLKTLEKGVKSYVDFLERTIISFLTTFDIHAFQIDGLTGIWTGKKGDEKKIAAIGIRVSQGVTKHGFALNVTTDLNYFSLMVPCGINDKDVTSMEVETGEKLNWNTVAKEFANHFDNEFSSWSL
jgi:lipoyl(octanoyl) transferase